MSFGDSIPHPAIRMLWSLAASTLDQSHERRELGMATQREEPRGHELAGEDLAAQ